MLDRSSIMARMNKLATADRVRVLAALVEGNSIRATVRMTGVAKNTVVKLLADVGAACQKFHDEKVRNLACKKVQCDEIWSFCYAKQRNVPEDKRGQFGYGDVWTWTGMDADTKLMVSYMVGQRDADCACAFMHDVAGRMTGRIQLTTDGLKYYMLAVEGAFGWDVDYSQLIKTYGPSMNGGTAQARYSPGVCIGAMESYVCGEPHPGKVSTSFIERQNLTMRMGMRRFTRLTNGFSKKVENLAHAVALHFMHYNFCRVHQTLRITPAMASGLSDHVWELEEIVALLG
jgi:IS1 family transposase